MKATLATITVSLFAISCFSAETPSGNAVNYNAVTNAIRTNPSAVLSLLSGYSSAGGVLSGAATAPAFDLLSPATLTPVDAGTAINFGAANRTASCTLTGQVTFTYSGLAGTNVLTYNLQIQNAQATNCQFTFPTGTRIMGIAGYQTAGKGGRMTFEYWPSLATNVFYVESQ